MKKRTILMGTGLAAVLTALMAAACIIYTDRTLKTLFGKKA